MGDFYDVSRGDRWVGRVGRVHPVAGDVVGYGFYNGVPSAGAEGGAGPVVFVCVADLSDFGPREWGSCVFVEEVSDLVES